MSARRDFLRGLVSLPLVGGSVELVGAPSAVAEPVTLGLMVQYANWLFYERRMLGEEVRRTVPLDLDRVAYLNPGTVAAHGSFQPIQAHWPTYFPSDEDALPSSRAALVMGAAGFNWRPQV